MRTSQTAGAVRMRAERDHRRTEEEVKMLEWTEEGNLVAVVKKTT